jgi:hypothetical protein
VLGNDEYTTKYLAALMCQFYNRDISYGDVTPCSVMQGAG